MFVFIRFCLKKLLFFYIFYNKSAAAMVSVINNKQTGRFHNPYGRLYESIVTDVADSLSTTIISHTLLSKGTITHNSLFYKLGKVYFL